MPLRARATKTWRVLAGDVRQAFVGWVFLLAVPLVGAVVITAALGDVPAWSLALVLVVLVVGLAWSSRFRDRELGRLEGELRLERKRREELEERLGNQGQPATGRPDGDGAERGFLFRIQALRGELEGRAGDIISFDISKSQRRALRNLAADVRAQVGPTETLDDIVNQWGGSSGDTDDAITALGQLEGIVIGSDSLAGTSA